MWLELHQAVWTHRKTFELASALGLDDTYAAAHVIRLWSWALDNAPDGDLSHLSARAIAYGAGWRAGATEAFLRALVEVGWIDEDHRIHDWDDYAGRLVDRREANATRMRAARAARSGQKNGARVPDVRVTSGARAGATGPNLTGPNRTGHTHTSCVPPNPPPAGGQSPLTRRSTRAEKTSEPTTEPAEPFTPMLTPEEVAEWQSRI